MAPAPLSCDGGGRRVRGEAVLSCLYWRGGRLTGGWINKDALCLLCSPAGHVESSAVTPVSSPFFIFL
jgi:hypothetical protein